MDDHAKSMTKDCLDTLRQIMLDELADAEARVAAAKEILYRGWGNSSTPVFIRVEDDTP